MSRVLLARAALAAMGIIVWGYGAWADEPRVRFVGMILLAVSLLLRFAPGGGSGRRGRGRGGAEDDQATG